MFDNLQPYGLYVACQAPLSMGFSMQEYWSGLPCPPPRDLPNLRIKPESRMSPALAGRFFTTSATWEAQTIQKIIVKRKNKTKQNKQTNKKYIYIYIHISLSPCLPFLSSQISMPEESLFQFLLHPPNGTFCTHKYIYFLDPHLKSLALKSLSQS